MYCGSCWNQWFIYIGGCFNVVFLILTPIVGEMMEFDYVSNGLKPYPTSSWICLVGDVLRIVPWDSSRFFTTIWDTLPETNSSPLKSYLPNRKVVFQPPFFRRYVTLSGVYFLFSKNLKQIQVMHVELGSFSHPMG